MFDNAGLFEKILFLSFGKTTTVHSIKLIAAGNINQGVFLDTGLGRFFLKLNFEHAADIFQKESNGLELLRKHGSLTVPEVYHTGSLEERNYLLMEWIETGRPDRNYWQSLGEGLAELHMTTRMDFGLDQENYIASLAQKNTPLDCWKDFFIQNRLEPLIGKAFYAQLISEQFLNHFRKVYDKLDQIFPKERPALLHGDFWSGNVLVGKSGLPVLIDPAVYFGHREMDLAFSSLFGGFSESFYEAYQSVFPLEPGFEERIPVYNLYPLLVHLLLFGKSYLPGIEKTVNRLLG